MLTQQQIGDFRKMLEQRFLELRESVRQALLQADEQNYVELAGRVGDLENSSLADLLVDVSLAEIDRLVGQIRDIDASLLRIAHGSYGLCTDCGNEIEVARLQAHPTAKRCRPCQMIYEESGREPHRSTSL
jgi:RNA polymerase-binding protein DksA